MSEQDRVLTRRTVLSGLTLGTGVSGVLAIAGLFDQSSDAPHGDETSPAADTSVIDPSPPAEYKRPENPLPVEPPRREFYFRPSASAGQTFGDLFLPRSATARLPVVVLVHGGGWGQSLGLGYMEGYARDLAAHDVAVWNVEYRRTGSGGGWPTTVADVCDAVDFLPALSEKVGGRLDLRRVTVCGHSAGGHLALWIASRPRLPEHLPGAKPTQTVAGCVSLAGVTDLLRAEAAGDGFVRQLLGGVPRDVRQRYLDASPISHLPTGIPVACLHGTEDQVVRPVQSEDYVRRALSAGDPARLVLHPGGDHDPWGNLSGDPWKTARGILLEMMGLAGPVPSPAPPRPTPGTPVPPRSPTAGPRQEGPS